MGDETMTKIKEKLPFQFLNSVYTKRRFKDGRMIQSDYLVIVYRDERDGKKKLLVKPEPTISFYIAKDHIDIKHPMNFIGIEHVDIAKSSYHDLPKNLAKLGDMEQDFYDIMR
jgi:hypothetical protein